MGNSIFSFKQFSIDQSHCAMKVGTDGVLLGAWTTLLGGEHVLDIGTGTGLIALMLAQRGAGAVDAVEIDSAAAQQATNNALNSPWNERIRVERCDFTHYALQATQRYDLVVSNPPYFEDSLLPPTLGRTLARHTHALGYAQLLDGAVSLLSPQGRVALIFPIQAEQRVEEIAGELGLHLARRVYVRGNSQSPIKRVLAEWQLRPTSTTTHELVVEVARHQYSAEYIALTRDFYLKM